MRGCGGLPNCCGDGWPGGGAGGGFPERSGSTAFARAEDAIVGGADVGFDASVVDFFQSAAGAAAEGDEAEILFDIADGRKIEFPEIEILVEEGRAVGVETGLFADLADDADVGFLVFFGPAEDELLFRGKFVAGENAQERMPAPWRLRRTVVVRSENMRPSKSEPMRRMGICLGMRAERRTEKGGQVGGQGERASETI